MLALCEIVRQNLSRSDIFHYRFYCTFLLVLFDNSPNRPSTNRQLYSTSVENFIGRLPTLLIRHFPKLLFGRLPKLILGILPTDSPQSTMNNLTTISPSMSPMSDLTCNVGIDEAGRGPVLGPMVYGIAVSPVVLHDQLVEMGVADSKALTEQRRREILGEMDGEKGEVCAYALRVLSSNQLSRQQQRRAKQNLNDISHEAAFHLIQQVIDAGVNIATVSESTVLLP